MSCSVPGSPSSAKPGAFALRGERGVPEPAAGGRGGDVLGADAHEVREHGPVGRLDDRAVGDAEHQVRARGARAVVAHALRAGRRVPVGRVVVVEQRRDLRVDLDDHRAAVATVAPVGPGQRLELLPVDGRTTVPTVTAGRMQHDPVDECHHG
jgi:hypothetical protein